MGIIIDEQLEEYRKLVKKELDKKRYIHSLGVSYTAAGLAMKYGENINKARIAGLLHDCAKSYSSEELIKSCHKVNIPVSEFEIDNPELLHSKYGSYLANSKYNITDENILNAIYYHTTGRENMSLLEKIIFTADYIEPNRTELEGISSIRQEAFTDIDRAIVSICEKTLSYLNKSNKTIDITTVNTYKYYQNLVNNRGN